MKTKFDKYKETDRKEVMPGGNDRKQRKNRGVLLKGLRMQGFLRGSGYE